MKLFFSILSKSKSVPGFTLVEMLVSSSIFAMMVLIATGALFSAQNLNTRVQQTQIILDGINLSLETMVRDIRYGYNYHCAQDFSTSTPPINDDLRRSCALVIDGSDPTAYAGRAIIFHPVSASGSTARIAYFVGPLGQGQGSAIFKATCNPNPLGGACIWADNVEQMTGTDANIQNLSFFVVGANSSTALDGTNYSNASDMMQPFVTILVTGKTNPTDGTAPVPFSVEYSTASRTIDN